MFTIKKHSGHRLDIALSGKVETEQMTKALDNLIELSQGVEHGTMMYKISDFSLPSLGAIGVEMARLPQLFGLLSKFDKCAVLSDSSWLRTAAAVEGALFPGIDIKAFEMDEAEAAETWLAAPV